VLAVGCYKDMAGPALQQGSDSDLANLPPGERMLRAAGAGDVKTMESLVAMDPTTVEAVGINGMKPLHAAASTGQSAAVTFLLENGANPLAVDDESNTALNMANVEGHSGTAQIIQDWIANSGAAPAPPAPAQ